MTHLLDTDTCVFALRGHVSVRNRLAEIDAETVGISVITLAELYYVADCSANPLANHQAVEDFTTGVGVIGLDKGIVRLFGDFKAQLRRRGELIDDFDLLIAATAHHYQLTLVTHNLDHFGRLPVLQLEDWVHT